MKCILQLFFIVFSVGNLCSTMFHVGHGFVRCNTYTRCKKLDGTIKLRVEGFCESIICIDENHVSFGLKFVL
jgi:hypothetical protein